MKIRLDLSRQAKMVPIDKINEYAFEVFGVGSVGSKFVRDLAKTGAKNIKVYDMDTVALENISAQAFDFEHIGMKKVDAIKDIVKKGSGIDIETQHGLVKKTTELTAQNSTIYCCFFDSLNARKLVFDKLKDFPIMFIDGRIGEFNKRFYFVDCADEKTVKDYSESLEVKNVSELACGEKANAAINSIISGEIIMNIVSLITTGNYIKTHIGNVMFPKNNIYILKEQATE